MNMIIHITRIFAKNIFLIPIGHAMRVVVKMDFVKKKKNFVQKTLPRWLTIFSANNSQLSYSFYYLLQNSGPRIFFFFSSKTRAHAHTLFSHRPYPHHLLCLKSQPHSLRCHTTLTRSPHRRTGHVSHQPPLRHPPTHQQPL